jgi:hypothetical protein
MQQSESIAELAKALAAAQGEFKPIPRTADNPFFKSKYADLASIVEATAPILAAHGLSIAQFPTWDPGTGAEELVTMLMHGSGQFLRSSMLLRLKDLTAQAQGSAITYCRRYAYSAAAGIVTDEDDDGNKATSQAAQRQAAPRPGRPRQAPPSPETGEIEDPEGDAVADRRQYARQQLAAAFDTGLVDAETANELWAGYNNAYHETWLAELQRLTEPKPANVTLMARATEAQATQQRTRQSPMRPMP